MTAALEGGEWSAARPGRTLPLGKTRYPFYRRLGGPQGRSGRTENLVPTGIRFRTDLHLLTSLKLKGKRMKPGNLITKQYSSREEKMYQWLLQVSHVALQIYVLRNETQIPPPPLPQNMHCSTNVANQRTGASVPIRLFSCLKINGKMALDTK